MIKTVLFYIFYIYCVYAEPRYLRHLSYATGMEGPRYLSNTKTYEEFTDLYETNY